MPSIAFLWDYTPRFMPFSPVPNEKAMVGQAVYMSAGRDSAFQYYGDWHQLFPLASNLQRMFGGDFYERFHFSTLTFALGNLVGNQTRELRVWNAYRRARVLEDLELINGEGIAISGQPSPPLQFAPLQERVYQIEISTDGPPSVDALLVFDLDEGESVTISITGSRVTPWIFRPDWSSGINESLEWLTDITESENANEQASALRLGPRRAIGFSFGVEGQARQAMETAVAGWGGRVWSVPIWTDGAELSTSLLAGVDTIPVPTLGRDFYNGGLAMITGTDWRDYEVVEVETVASQQIQLKRPTGRAWPRGSIVYPSRTGRLDGGATFNRFTGQAHTGSVTFNLLSPNDWPELTDLPTYRGLPVLEDRPEWSAEPSILHQRKLAIWDNQLGRPEYTDRADIDLMRQSHRWTAVGRAQLARIRSLAYRLRGKCKAIWVPSWVDDFTLQTTAAQTATQLELDWTGYATYINAARNRRDLRIANSAGIQYMRILAATEASTTMERFATDSPMARTYLPGETTISYLTLWRLDTDRLEWAWWCGDMGQDQATADVAMPMRTFRHDL